MNFLYYFDLFGTFIFAITGALVGINKNMNVFGVFILAFVTGVGGGTIRDIILGRTPPFAFKDIWYITVITAATIFVLLFHTYIRKNMKLLNDCDAVGLGVFTCIGADIAKESGIPWYGVIFFGVVTAVAGGLIRDIFAQELPFVLQKEVYAAASVIGGCLFLILDHFCTALGLNMVITALVVIIIRVLAVYNKLDFLMKW